MMKTQPTPEQQEQREKCQDAKCDLSLRVYEATARQYIGSGLWKHILAWRRCRDTTHLIDTRPHWVRSQVTALLRHSTCSSTRHGACRSSPSSWPQSPSCGARHRSPYHSRCTTGAHRTPAGGIKYKNPQVSSTPSDTGTGKPRQGSRVRHEANGRSKSTTSVEFP